jgi:hypothetical protein
MAKTITELQNEIEDAKLNSAAWETALSQSQNEEERFRLKNKIDEAQGLIKEIEKLITAREDREQKLQKKNLWKDEQELVDNAIEENFIGYIIPENRFIYCRNFGTEQINIQFNFVAASNIIRILNKMIGRTIRGKEYQEMIDYFEKNKQTFYTVTSSFNNRKWNQEDVYNKMSVIRQHWITPDFQNTDYDPRFDLLIHSVCGGKQENIDHLEKWIGFKYLYPERTAVTPNLDLCGQPGGNGKQITIEMLKTIFTPLCVVQAHREELEKFNSNWENATVLYYDEPDEKELAANRLKQATGSEDLRIEKKGIDATMADRNYNFIFMSNNDNGVVKLSGGSAGGEDRRYSVINTNLVLFDTLLKQKYTADQASSFLNGMAQELVKSRAEVAKWLAAIIQRHKLIEMKNLPALHGVDYHCRFNDQKEPIETAFDRILPVAQSQQFMPLSVLGDLARALTETDTWKDKNVGSRFETYLRRNRISYSVQERKHWAIVWHNNEIKKAQSKCYIFGTGNPSNDFEMNTVRSNSPKIGGIDKNNCILGDSCVTNTVP